MASDLPSAGAKLELDLSAWESNWSSAMDNVDTLTSALDDLSGSVDVDVNIDVPDTSELDTLQELDGESITTEVDTTQSEDSKSIVDNLNFLATLEKIKIAIDVVGTALDFVQAVGSFVVTPFLNVEDAVARINAQTGGGTGIADLGDFIRGIQAADLGESVDQIADVTIKAKQLNLPIQEAVTSALLFTHTWTDQDPNTVVGAWGAALQTGIVDNMQEASDLMTVFFQHGGNIGGDAVQVVQDNAQAWADMNLTMAEGLSLMDSLQNGTGATAGDASKMMLTFDNAFTKAAADPNSQEAKLLNMIGIDNPKTAGEAIGAETFDAFAAAFKTASSENQDLMSGVFFGKGGKKFTGAIGEMSSQEEMFKDVTDAAADAATEIDNSLRGAIADFVTEVNAKIAELLSSDKIDLPGKIKALKEGFQEAVDVLANGGTVGEALEVALNIPGLSDTLNTFIGNFERIVGNIEIAFLQVVATIQDITGHGKEADATRATIKDRSLGQFKFDLQLADPSQIPTLIETAISRGLSFDELDVAVPQALNETLANMNFDQGAKILEGLITESAKNGAPDAWNAVAADYVTKLQGGFDNAMSAGNLDMMSKLMTIDPNAKIPGLDEAVAGFQKQLSDAFTPQDRSGDTGGNPFLTGLGAGIGKQGAETSGGMMGFAPVIKDFKDAITDAQTTSSTATDGIAANFDHVNTAATDNLAAVNTALDTTGMSVEGLDMRVVNALTGNTVTASFQAVADSAAATFPGVMDWMARAGQAAAQFDNIVSLHLRNVIKQLADLNFLAQQTILNVTQAQGLGGGGGGTTNNTTNNVTVNNNVNGNAAAAANGYAIAGSLRPGGG